MLPLFVSDVSLQCINAAAYEYHVPAKLIIAVLNVERGRAGLKVCNKNGSYDLGPMQINTSWWPKLYKYNITPNEVLYDPCKNVEVGSWILAGAIAQGNNLFRGVGDYHSHTAIYNQEYSERARLSYTELVRKLRLEKSAHGPQ